MFVCFLNSGKLTLRSHKTSPVLPFDVLQFPVVPLQVLGQRGEIFLQQVLEGLLLLRADDLAGGKAQAELIRRALHLPGYQARDVVPTVPAEADDHGDVGVGLAVGVDDALQLLVDEGEALLVGEDADDGQLGDEAQVGPQLGDVGRLLFFPGFEVLLPDLEQRGGEVGVALVEEGAEVHGAVDVGDLQLGFHDGGHGLGDVLAEVEAVEVVGQGVPLLLGDGLQLLHKGRVLLQAGVQPAEEVLFRAAFRGVLVLASKLLPGLVALPSLLVQLVGLFFLSGKKKDINGRTRLYFREIYL